MKHPLVYIIIVLVLFSCTSQKTAQKTSEIPVKNNPSKPILINQPDKAKEIALPEVPREFRAVWIATVANINWPSNRELSMEDQKSEALYILDKLKEANFNAVIFQARPSADALYKSNLEPWSYFLTGKLGQDPGYDPLEFWITEAHKRGMELHAWLNPFRAYHTSGGPITTESMVIKMPNDVVRLRNGTYWFDPSSQNVQNHVSAVILDLISRYDLDGIHLDDYFYPYKEYNYGRDFPDETSYSIYKSYGGSLNKEDWRRENVNKFVKRIYAEIKTTKNNVKFGISPFGIWKSGYPEDVVGSSQYDDIFADAKLWLNQGWVDYFSPQLYWKEEGNQRFSSLLKWWKSENTQNRHLWVGLNTVGVKDVEDRPTEIMSQLNYIRQILPNDKGEIHYSIDGIKNSQNMFNTIKYVYKNPVLVPKTPWLKAEPLVKPSLNIVKNANNLIVNWGSTDANKVFHWILYTKTGEQWNYEILNAKILSKTLDNTSSKYNAVALKSVDRLGNESLYTMEIIK